ncbi:MAG TPA: S8 family serine peptidase [Ignavibacteriales bacterium]|nr:S8 family serine peptidase [Ignavibacteriales bacterium]
MFKKIFIFIATAVILMAQNNKLTNTLKYHLQKNPAQNIFVWITFTDKGPDTNLYRNNPSTILSQRSIQRRMKFFSNEKIIDYTDYPVYNQYLNLLNQQGVNVRYKSKWLNSVSAFVLPAQINTIKNLSFVKKIDVMQFYTAKRIETQFESNKLTSYKIGQFDYGYSFSQNNIMNAVYAHNLGLSGKGVMIGMFDAGFTNLKHKVFNNLKIHTMWDFVNNNYGVEDSTDEGLGDHGTATLSCIGGFSPGELIGPAFNSTYVLAKTENTYSETPLEEDNWIAAIEWADSIGIDVASTSLGYIEYDSPYYGYTWQNMDGKSSKITLAADIAVTKGILVFNSAGNEGDNDSHNTLGKPADGFNVISVGAVNKYGERASFSSVGPTIDGRIKPEIMAMGQAVYVASSYGNEYHYSSGTSFSCPLAAGAAALLLEANPYLSPSQIRDIFISTATNSETPNYKIGWGIIDLKKAIEEAKVKIIHSPMNINYDNNTLKIYASFVSYDKLKSAYLYYRYDAASSFDSIKFNFLNGNNYYAEIKNYKSNEKIYYYIKAKNGSIFESKLPANAPDSLLIINLKPDSIENFLKNRDFILYQNYPNPFNPTTNIKFQIIKAGFYSLKLYNSQGDMIKEYFNKYLLPGIYQDKFDFSAYSSSVYFLELKSDNKSSIIKLSFVK